MGGGSLILFLYLGCALLVMAITGVGAVLYVIGRRREASARERADRGER
jgi:hypothetical protein